MSSSVFLHKFYQGREVTTSFRQVIDFLGRHGSPGTGQYNNEITFPPEEIGDLASVVGSEIDGALCVAIDRPLINDQFRLFVFEAMQQFGFSAYEDTFDWVYVPLGSSSDVPQTLLEELSHGVQEVRAAAQLWPSDA